MTSRLFIRVTLKLIPIAAVLERLPLDLSIYAIEGNDTENPHVHVYLETDLGHAAIRARLSTVAKAHGTKGNAAYSIKQVPHTEDDVCKTVAYVTKYGAYVSTLPEEVLARALEYDAKVKQEMKAMKAKSIMKDLEARLLDLAKDYVPTDPKTITPEQAVEMLRTGQRLPLTLWQDRTRVAAYIMEYHHIHQLTVRPANLQAYMDTIVSRHCPIYASRMVAMVANRYF